MKRVVILIVTLAFLSGCSNGKNLTCTIEDKSEELTMTQEVKAVFKNNKLNSAILKVEYDVSDLDMIDTVKKAAVSSFEEYIEYNGIESNEKEKGNTYIYELKIDATKVDSDILYSLNLKGTEYSELTDTLVGNGYICK